MFIFLCSGKDINILFYACAWEICRLSLVVCIFINCFIIQLCCSSSSHYYGNQPQSLNQSLALIQGGRKEKIFFIIFSQQMFTCDFWHCECSPSLSQWRTSHLLGKEKKALLADNLPTSRRQLHLTTYQLLVVQTLCGVQQ